MTTPTHKPKSWKRPERTRSKLLNLPPEQVVAEREILLARLARLQSYVKEQRGYRTATTLLSKRFLVASHATQLACCKPPASCSTYSKDSLRPSRLLKFGTADSGERI